MAVKDVFQVLLYATPRSMVIPDPETLELIDGIDITDGILSVETISGTDDYQGPFQQIDSGQFTIVSRNPNLDPKINPNLKYNSGIRFIDTRENGGEFFRGYVTNVSVEYQRNDNPIITITGTDIFGAYQRVVVTEEIHEQIMDLSTGPTWNGITFTEFLPFMFDFSNEYLNLEYGIPSSGDGLIEEPNYGFYFLSTQSFAESDFGLLGFAPAKYIPQIGETFLDVINKYAQTNLTCFRAGDYQSIYVEPFVKNDPRYWSITPDPLSTYTQYDFSSDPVDGRPYESILLDNGYNRTINQIDVSNEYRYVEDGELKSQLENFTFTSEAGEGIAGITKANLSTIFPADLGLTTENLSRRFAETILQVVEFPSQEIQKITFDNARYEDIQNDFSYCNFKYEINLMIRIKHQINDNETLDRVYDIAGISHSITPDRWTMTFTLKPAKEEIAYKFQGEGYVPTIEMNSLTGDSNFNFTATIVNYPTELINSVSWALNAIFPDEIAAIYPTVFNEQRYNDIAVKTGLTQTWNFDDDGILNPYSFDLENYPPVDNRFGGNGPGFWTVYAYIILKNLYTVVVQQTIEVGTPEVRADFGWTQNLTNNFGQVSFIDTSVNHELDEPDSYLWDFGDGNTSTLKNPVHTYVPVTDENEYDVSLTVFTYGPEQEKVYDTKTVTVTLTQPTMVPNFTTAISQNTVRFTNTSTNVGFEEPDAYFWEFGDGEVSTAKNPIKVYPVPQNESRSFTVKLTTRNIWEQTETVTKTITILAVNASGNFPVRYIKLRIDDFTPEGPDITGYFKVINPMMVYLRGLTSGTNANLLFNKNTINVQDQYFPFTWWAADYPSLDCKPFTNPLFAPENYKQGNLTRNPADVTSFGSSPGRIGLQPIARQSIPFSWEVVIDLGTRIYLIDRIVLDFLDFFRTSGLGAGLQISDFYPKISVDFATTIGSYIPKPGFPGVTGPPTLTGNWVNVGYFKVDGGRMDPTKPAGQQTQVTKTMTEIRPLPLNIPYFNYTFNDKIVSFESIETADSYAWTFGDGTTSTLKNPVKTYASYGTYTVTLAVTKGGVVTRTTTEPVIVRVPVT
jgi:PKD repeat protein